MLYTQRSAHAPGNSWWGGHRAGDRERAQDAGRRLSEPGPRGSSREPCSLRAAPGPSAGATGGAFARLIRPEGPGASGLLLPPKRSEARSAALTAWPGARPPTRCEPPAPGAPLSGARPRWHPVRDDARERAGDGGRGGVTPTEGAAPPGPKAARTWTAAGVSGSPAPAFAGTTFPSAFVGLSPGVASARPPVSITGWSERLPGSLHGTQRASARSREAARGGRARLAPSRGA